METNDVLHCTPSPIWRQGLTKRLNGRDEGTKGRRDEGERPKVEKGSVRVPAWASVTPTGSRGFRLRRTGGVPACRDGTRGSRVVIALTALGGRRMPCVVCVPGPAGTDSPCDPVSTGSLRFARPPSKGRIGGRARRWRGFGPSRVGPSLALGVRIGLRLRPATGPLNPSRTHV